MPNYQRRIVYLSEAQREELFSNGSITVNGATITYDANDMYVTPQEEPYVKPVGGIPGSDLASDAFPQEVIVSSTQPADEGNKIWIGEDSGTEYSVPTMADLDNYVQKTDYATYSDYGVVKLQSGGGLQFDSTSNNIKIDTASSSHTKAGTNTLRPITAFNQHESAFYGLAKAAGSDMASSSNAVGTYTDTAKAAIQTMLGVPGDVQINGTSIVNNGVANVPIADSTNFGVVKIDLANGITLSNNALAIVGSSVAQYKTGGSNYRVVTPYGQHNAVFYGLAKAAGADMASSSNAVGTYTDAAKIAIQKMLGIYQAPWELIREDTFTNAEEADHTITVDGNGNPFELTDVIYLFETPKLATSAEVVDYGKTYFYYDSTNMIQIAMGAYTQAANSSAHGAYAKITCEDGIVTFEYAAQSTSGSGANIRRIYRENFSDVYNISNFSISKIVICKVTGTAHYKIYGKRKWT